MPLFDLSKRRSRRRGRSDAPRPAEAPHAESSSSDATPREEGTEEPTLPMPTERALVPFVPPAGLAEAALAALARGQEVLVLGAALWDDPERAGALMARTRGLTLVDPDPARLARLRHYAQASIASELDAPAWLARLGTRRFDVVIAGEALGQLVEPERLLESARACLKPDGYLLAIVPNVAHGEMRLGLMQGEFPRDIGGRAIIHHYTRDRLRERLAFAGYALTALEGVRRPLFDATSAYVPELFSAALLHALGQDDDLETAFFVARAVPAPPSALLRELFDERSDWRRAVRNELARATRTHEALTGRLVEADRDRDRLRDELATAQRATQQMSELAQRGEHNVRRLSQEVDELAGELETLKRSLAYKLLRWLLPKPRPAPGPGEGPGAWKYDARANDR